MRRKNTDGMMNGKEFEQAIAQLGISQRRAALHLLGLNERTVRRWVTDEAAVLPPAAQFLRYLIATKKSGDYAIKKLEGL